MAFVVLAGIVGVIMGSILLFAWLWPIPGQPRPAAQLWQELKRSWVRTEPRGLTTDVREILGDQVSQKSALPQTRSQEALSNWVSSSIAASRPDVSAEERERAKMAKFSWDDEIARAELIDREANRPATAQLALNSGIELPELREYLSALERACNQPGNRGCCMWPNTRPSGMWDYKHDFYGLTGAEAGHRKLQAIANILRSQGFAVRYCPTQYLSADTIHRRIYVDLDGQPAPFNFVQCIGDATALAAQQREEEVRDGVSGATEDQPDASHPAAGTGQV